ncbi:phage tail tape measure protein [bacterium]|nr:phage tail tape measure protein [bacterium]
MAHEAIINFLFNSEGAMREIDNFKSRFSKALDGLADSASKIGTIFGISGGITGGFAIKNVMDNIQRMNDLIVRYSDLPIEEVGRFSNALRLLGATPEEATGALESLERVIQEAIPSGRLPQYMEQLGLKLHDENGNVKTSIKLYKELDEKLRAIKDTTKRDLLINKIIGSEVGLSGGAFTAMKRLVMQSEDERKAFSEKLGKFWTPSEEDAKRIQNFSDSINSLKVRFDELGKVLLDLGAKDLIDWLNKGIERFNNASPDTQKGIMYLIAGLILLKPTIKTIKGLANAFKLLGGVVTSGGGLLTLATLIGMVAFNIGGAHDALDEWIKGFEKWADEVEKEHPKVGKFLKMLGKAGEWISHPWDKLFENFGDSILAAEKKWEDFKEWLSTPFELPDWMKDIVDWFREDEKNTKSVIKSPINNPSLNNKNITFNTNFNFEVKGNMSEETGKKLVEYSDNILRKFQLQDYAIQIGAQNLSGG